MKELIVSGTEAGQRFDKFLMRRLPNAGKSFLYKMLRKKNIVLNGKKAEGSELLVKGDEVKIFFADETFEKFAGTDAKQTASAPKGFIPDKTDGKGSNKGQADAIDLSRFKVVYENDHILAFDKPAGLLSQKAETDDISAVEYVAAYLESKGVNEPGFKPSVSNRLDRNTSGLMLAGKSIYGQRKLAEMLKDRTIEKYYLCIVKGEVKKPERVESFLTKNTETNTVTVDEKSGEEKIITAFRPIAVAELGTLLEVELITGKSHQIRAQLSALGHPIAGDSKYGDKAYNSEMKARFGVRHQTLHAFRMVFPECGEELKDLSGREIKTELPKEIEHFCRAFGIEE